MSGPDRRKKKKEPSPGLIAVPELLDWDLEGWAGARVASAGRKDALLGRVELLRLASDRQSLESHVRGNRPRPYEVRVRIAPAGLEWDCTCGEEHRVPCRHAVASLEALRFPSSHLPGKPANQRPRVGRTARGRGRIVQHAGNGEGFVLLGGPERALHREERIAVACEEELAARRHRASRERAKVTLLPPDGGPPTFMVEDRRLDRACRVRLRGAKADLAACDCADFASNELQTCRHIERARRWYARKKKEPLGRTLSLWWRPRRWIDRMPTRLREIRLDTPDEVLPAPLERHFDGEGFLRAAPEGTQPVCWVREALDAAGREARQQGWRFDLDPAVEPLIVSEEERRRLTTRLQTVSRDEAIWRECTADLSFKLHPYQEEGILFLAHRGRAFLADDMGLGKTVQAIVASLLLARLDGARKMLVVCPASLKHQWHGEIRAACDEQATVIEGPRRQRLRAYESWNRGFLILNYELVLRDLEAIVAAGANLIILDEAQRIKNWNTKTAQAVKQLRSRHAFILTGTPLENRLLELHSLVEFLHPSALGPRWRLVPTHAVTEGRERVVAYEGLDILRSRLRGFFLRRDRRQVLDQLPERTDNTFWTGMTQAQLRPYRHYSSTVAALLSRQQSLSPGEVRTLLQSLTRMRILCNAWAQHAWEEFAPRIREGSPPSAADLKRLASPKLEEFARVLEELLDESDEKIVVFSQWERMLRLARFVVSDLLRARDLRASLFHGGLTSRARAQVLEGFDADPEIRVLFSTDAGGLGLNLQRAASIVVNLEVPWNPAVLEQRIGRVHRIGQRHSVQVLHFVTRGAIEERVRQVVAEKRALFEGLLVDQVDQVTFDGDQRSSFVRRLNDLFGDSPRRATNTSG